MPIKIKSKRNNKKLDSVIVENISPEKAQLLHQIEEKDFDNITAETEQIIC